MKAVWQLTEKRGSESTAVSTDPYLVRGGEKALCTEAALALRALGRHPWAGGLCLHQHRGALFVGAVQTMGLRDRELHLHVLQNLEHSNRNERIIRAASPKYLYLVNSGGYLHKKEVVCVGSLHISASRPGWGYLQVLGEVLEEHQHIPVSLCNPHLHHSTPPSLPSGPQGSP